MKKDYPSIYESYDIKPYIDPNRNVEDWLLNTNKYPYGIVEKKENGIK